MNIEQLKSDSLSVTLKLNVEVADYAPRVKKSLHELRRKTEVKGFRKGMVPPGLIHKMYGRTVLLEEVNKLISEELEKYIHENNIKIIGEALPDDELTKEIDWERDESFSFVFDLILAPIVELTLTEDDHIPIKEAKISKKEKDEYVESLRKQYGRFADVESVEKGDDFLKVDLSQGEKSVKATHITLRSITEEELKQPFIGAKVGDIVKVDVVKTFPNLTDRASLLNMKKEELDDTEPLWQATVLEIRRFSPAPFDKEFYTQLFGEGVVKTKEAFMKKVEEQMQNDFASERDFRFTVDAREYLIEKCAIELPDMLLKRWLHLNNDGKFSMEEIDKDYDAFARDFRWQLIRGHLMREHNLTITKEEMMSNAIRVAYHRFASYGYSNVPMEGLEKFAQNMLANEKEAGRIAEMAQDGKVFALIRSVVTLDAEKVPFSKIKDINN